MALTCGVTAPAHSARDPVNATFPKDFHGLVLAVTVSPLWPACVTSLASEALRELGVVDADGLRQQP
jgi:hypothetical protein